MAKKKVAKKAGRKKVSKPARKKVVRHVSKPARKKTSPVKMKSKLPMGRKMMISIRNLIIFAVLFFFTLGMQKFSNQVAYQELYSILSIVFGFVALAFLLVTLIFLILKLIRKR